MVFITTYLFHLQINTSEKIYLPVLQYLKVRSPGWSTINHNWVGKFSVLLSNVFHFSPEILRITNFKVIELKSKTEYLFIDCNLLLCEVIWLSVAYPIGILMRILLLPTKILVREINVIFLYCLYLIERNLFIICSCISLVVEFL